MRKRQTVPVHVPRGKATSLYQKFPKPFNNVMEVGQDSFAKYKRRHLDNGGITADIRARGKTIPTDNRWVVPYSPILLKAMNCHLNT